MAYNASTYPYDTVVFITDTIDGQSWQGSGVLISPDEVLTASHVVYIQGEGTATNIVVTPGYSSGSAPFGSTSGANIHYFQIDDANGLITNEQSQSDYAVIHLARPFANVGYMGLQANFTGGPVSITGYPASAGGAQIDSMQVDYHDPFYTLLDGTALGEGSSGGPVWIETAKGPDVVGLVSSASNTNATGYNVLITTAVFNQIEAWVASDDNIVVPPAISGTVANQMVSDQTTIAPFSKVTLADANAGQTETVTVTLSVTANGTLSNLGSGGFNAATGTYSVTGGAAAVSTALDALVFTPTGHQVAPGQTVTTNFTIQDTDTAGQTAADTTTSVVATAVAVPLTINNTVAGQAVTDLATVAPLPVVTIADPNFGQTETATVTLSGAANGTLSNLGSGTYNAAAGVYTVIGTAAEVTAALEGLLFTPTIHQVTPGNTVTTIFTIADTDSAMVTASNNATSIVVTATAPPPNSGAVSAAYQGIMRVVPPGGPTGATVTAVANQINAGQLTLAGYETSLINLDQALYTTIAALVTIDACYNATPNSSNLTSVATATSGTSYYTAAELHNLGYSDTNVWTVLAAGWGADPGSAFYASYNIDATGTTAGYTAFINSVYAREFGAAPTAANLANLLADVPGTQSLLNGGGHVATPIQVMSGLYGYLLEVGQTNGIGQYASATSAFLQAAANGTVTYGPELTTEFPAAAAAGVTLASADPASITITGSHQLLNPGAGDRGIRFLTGAAPDTPMPRAAGSDRSSGFDPARDAEYPGSLLIGTGLDMTGDDVAPGHDLTAGAPLRFDAAGLSGAAVVALSRGPDHGVTGLESLIAHGAIQFP